MVNRTPLQRAAKAFHVVQALAMHLLAALKVYQRPAAASGR
jgi:hypothetical protein